ncbi:peptidase S8/S53 domain-containing protein [Cadophora sp. MPI-SDFR-AT-0126]|nr:peptidase S8/S53 domain-containing protein [Leotiomycetes sp. MPI-SDFR-AT-0126]
MVLFGRILCLVASVSGAFALPKTTGNFVLHEKRDFESQTWRRVSRAHPSEALSVKIGLAQSNQHRAEEYLLDVSHPRSPNFGKHWTAEQVANTFAPSKETVHQVTEWLVEFGISAERQALSPGRNWIMFNATVLEAEVLFDTEYHYFEHHPSGGYRIACDQYSLPQHVRKHVDFAMPTIQLEGMRPIETMNLAITPPVVGLTGLENCYELITIECLRELYQFGPGNTSAPGNEIGIPAFGSYMYPPDLKLFFKNYTTQPIHPSVFPEFVSIDGGEPWSDSFNIGSEATLDIQTAYSIVHPQGVRLYQVGDINTASDGTFNTFLDALDGSYCSYLGGDAPYLDAVYPDPGGDGYDGPLQCGGAPMSNVLSFSYLQIEAALPESYQTRQCHEWMKLGLQGVSVIFASGDSGVANRYNIGLNSSCLTPPDEGSYIDVNGLRFSPSFPSNCPWVTTVGATFLKDRNISNGEVAVALPFAPNPKRDYYSGGGFSNVFAQPAYQADAVEHYLTTYPPPYDDQIYNKSGRGFPDVSAIGLNVSVVLGGGVQVAGGTSAATPIIASIVTLLNEARIAAGKGPIGFLNPILYAHPEAFNDITEGGNPGCGTEGFKAQPGWDPVTGLGSPNYPKLREIFLSLP